MPLSIQGLVSAFAPYTDQVWITLLRLTHSSFAVSPIRITDNGENVTSAGSLYYAFPFTIILPDQRGEAIPKAKFRASNIRTVDDGGSPVSLNELLRQIEPKDGPVRADMDLILSGTPDTVQLRFERLLLRMTRTTASVVEGEFVGPRILNADIRGARHRFTPETTPGVFRV